MFDIECFFESSRKRIAGIGREKFEKWSFVVKKLFCTETERQKVELILGYSMMKLSGTVTTVGLLLT